MALVARVWFGKTKDAGHEEYLEYVYKTGITSLRATRGNRGVIVLSNKHGKSPELGVISFWDSRDSIRGFAGDDINRAVYYAEDKQHLVTLEPYLLHYDVPIIEGVEFREKDRE